MESLFKYLTPKEVDLKDILLDPNNPRFAELGNDVDDIPENRFIEPKIQKDAYDKMRSDRFDVSELKDTIKTIGFLPMDMVVLREWKHDHDKFVVVEGNRRITALKWLIDLHNSGKETFSQDQLDNFQKLNVLILDQESAPSSSIWILPGLRHVSGIKEWGPYQKARAVYILRESGSSPQESAQSLGLSTRAANQLWRSYLALDQMQKDEEYGEYCNPRLYSYFEEIFKKVELREWLAWNDGERKFTNTLNIKELYSWIVGGIDDNDNPIEPKLSEAKSIRELAPIINDSHSMSILRSDGGTLLKARARFDADHPEEWQPVISKAEFILKNLSVEATKKMSAQDVITLENLSTRIATILEDRQKLLK